MVEEKIVKVGDWVTITNPTSGELTADKLYQIISISTQHNNPFYRVIMDNGKQNGYDMSRIDKINPQKDQVINNYNLY